MCIMSCAFLIHPSHIFKMNDVNGRSFLCASCHAHYYIHPTDIFKLYDVNGRCFLCPSCHAHYYFHPTDTPIMNDVNGRSLLCASCVDCVMLSVARARSPSLSRDFRRYPRFAEYAKYDRTYLLNLVSLKLAPYWSPAQYRRRRT